MLPAAPDLLTQILGFLYSAARYVGLGVIEAVRYLLPGVKNIETLAEPVGFLALLTIFVILTSTVRRVAMVVLAAGWALIFVRLLLMAFRIG